MAGYVKLHRKMLKWGWYSDTNTFRVFMHLLLTASYEENEFRGHKILPGQAIFGRKKMAKELGISERQVRVALEHLKMTNEVTIETTNKFSIATIENWGKYQLDDFTSDQQNDQQYVQRTANKCPTSDHTQEGKESKKVRIYRDIYKEPTVDDVREYCFEKGYTHVDPETFVNFYESKNWMVGKNKMKNWKSAVAGWESRNRKKAPAREGRLDWIDAL